MTSYRLNNMSFTIKKEGDFAFKKTTSPIRFGTYSEIKTRDYEFQFNLNGEIKFIRGLHGNWPHPSEFLKRTDGNDWVFYSVGSVNGNKGVKDWMGEYYLPCLPYPSNSVLDFNPYTDNRILNALAAWSQLFGSLCEMQSNDKHTEIKKFLNLVTSKDENTLFDRAKKLHNIIGERVSVLPPDARHVDYNVIPLIIADGCRYHCKFCAVKSSKQLKVRSMENIRLQIQQLKDYYGQNLVNYKGLFIGNHDALAAESEVICTSAFEAARCFGMDKEHSIRPKLYLFGSVDSLINASDKLLEELNQLPFYTTINVGFESVDASTLADIKKPLVVSKIHTAFQKMLAINQEYTNVEITANFLLGDGFSKDHYQSLTGLLSQTPAPSNNKGAIYLSPLSGNHKNENLLESFLEIKKQSCLPTFIYLIQRL